MLQGLCLIYFLASDQKESLQTNLYLFATQWPKQLSKRFATACDH